jgi:membrane-bound ClpP family serine protease
MADLQRRTPRAVRERRAYRLALLGSGTGVAGVACLVLAIVGVGVLGPAIVLLIVAALCAYGFMRTVGAR